MRGGVDKYSRFENFSVLNLRQGAVGWGLFQQNDSSSPALLLVALRGLFMFCAANPFTEVAGV